MLQNNPSPLAKKVADTGQGIIGSLIEALNPFGAAAIAKRHIAALGDGTGLDKKTKEKDNKEKLVNVDETNRFCLLTSMVAGLLSKLKLTPAINNPQQQDQKQETTTQHHRHHGPNDEVV